MYSDSAPVPERRRLRAPATSAWIALGICLSACAPTGAGTLAASGSVCRWEVADERRVRIETGEPAYVEPHTLVATSRGLLMLGIPTYVFPEAYPEEEAVEDSIVGVLLQPDGSTVGVPSPVPGTGIRGLSAIANEDGSWSVAFVVLRPGTRFPDDEVVGLGLGAFDGERWRSVDTESLPDGLAVLADDPARLARGAEGLFWALKTEPGTGPGLAILRREPDGWSVTSEPPSDAYWIDVAHLGEMGDAILVARPDRSRPGAPGWLRISPIDETVGAGYEIRPGFGTIERPVFDRSWKPRWVGWNRTVDESDGQRVEAVIAPLAPADSTRPGSVLADDIYSLLPLGSLGSDASFWITYELGVPDSELMLLRADADGADTLLTTGHPYGTWIGAVALDPSRVLVAGPYATFDGGATPPVVSHLMQLERRCSDA